jgi:predicted transposase YbfD/YdcC
MVTGTPVSLADAFPVIVDPRVAGRSTHDLVEILVVAVCATLCGADNFVDIELWANERLDWLRQFMKLEQGIASHDTMGRVFGMLDAQAVEASFRHWVSGLIPALEAGTVVAVDGKTSRRSGGGGRGALHLVSALVTGVGVVLGQEATREKSNEITAIPQLLQTLAIKGAIVTIDAAGTHAPIAQVIQKQGADYVLAVKDNQPLLADSIREFFATGQATHWARVAYDYYETIEKDHGRIEVRRYYAFGQLDCLAKPQQWPGLTMFGVVQSERTIKGKTSVAERLYIGSIPVKAKSLAHAVRSHWEVENRLHWCLDVCLNDDQARARVKNSAQNLAIVRRMVLNILRLDKSRKGGIKGRRMLACASDRYREQLLGFAASGI